HCVQPTHLFSMPTQWHSGCSLRSARRSIMVVFKQSLSAAALLLFLSFGTSQIQAQTVERKLEVSGLHTTIHLQVFDSRESGVGVRLAYNINKYLAVEAEGNAFEFSIGDHPTDEWLAAQGL